MLNFFQSKIDSLSIEECKDLIMKMIDNQPGLLFHLLEDGSSGAGYHPKPSSNRPKWCSCDNCRPMPKQEEEICCGKVPQDCISNLPVSKQDFLH